MLFLYISYLCAFGEWNRIGGSDDGAGKLVEDDWLGGNGGALLLAVVDVVHADADDLVGRGDRREQVDLIPRYTKFSTFHSTKKDQNDYCRKLCEIKNLEMYCSEIVRVCITWSEKLLGLRELRVVVLVHNVLVPDFRESVNF